MILWIAHPFPQEAGTRGVMFGLFAIIMICAAIFGWRFHLVNRNATLYTVAHRTVWQWLALAVCPRFVARRN
jgi:hypothetical protein